MLALPQGQDSHASGSDELIRGGRRASPRREPSVFQCPEEWTVAGRSGGRRCARLPLLPFVPEGINNSAARLHAASDCSVEPPLERTSPLRERLILHQRCLRLQQICPWRRVDCADVIQTRSIPEARFVLSQTPNPQRKRNCVAPQTPRSEAACGCTARPRYLRPGGIFVIRYAEKSAVPLNRHTKF